MTPTDGSGRARLHSSILTDAQRAENARVLLAHVNMALKAHLKLLGREAFPAPPGLQALIDLAGDLAYRRASEELPAVNIRPSPRLTLTLPETAAALGVSLSTVRRLMATDDLPTVLLGNQRRVLVADLVTWLEQRRPGPVSPGSDRGPTATAAPSASGDVSERHQRSRLAQKDAPGAA